MKTTIEVRQYFLEMMGNSAEQGMSQSSFAIFCEQAFVEL